jgi:hypothetical protein
MIFHFTLITGIKVTPKLFLIVIIALLGIACDDVIDNEKALHDWYVKVKPTFCVDDLSIKMKTAYSECENLVPKKVFEKFIVSYFNGNYHI